MNGQGEMIAVSGAPKEAFHPLATELGIQKMYLLEGEVVDGMYTGRVKVNMALGTEKRKVVQEITSAGFNRQASYAFGDHLRHDAPILNAVSSAFFVLDKNDKDREFKERRALAKGYTPVTKDDIIQKVKQRIAELESRE